MLQEGAAVSAVLIYWLLGVILTEGLVCKETARAINRLNAIAFTTVLGLFFLSWIVFQLAVDTSITWKVLLHSIGIVLEIVGGLVVFIVYAWRGGGVVLACPVLVMMREAEEAGEWIERMWKRLHGEKRRRVRGKEVEKKA